jgi:hypothetical protein
VHQKVRDSSPNAVFYFRHRIILTFCFAGAPPHRPHPVTAAPVSQSAKASSSSSASSAHASKKKKNDAEAFLDANELGVSESSVLPSPSKQPPSNNVASRLQTSQADATSAAAPKATAPKVAAKSIPAPLLAAAKKAGMSVANVSSKTVKATPAPLPSAASAAEVPISNPSQSAAFAATSSSKQVQIASVPAVASAIASRKETEHEVTTKVIGKAVDSDDIGRTTSSSSTPSIPVRRKRVVQSDDSDDAPSTPASRQPNTAAAASSSDAPIVTAASPTLDSSAKKPRVSILSSRASSAVTADVTATVEESVAGRHEVEELLVSKAAAAVADVPMSAAVSSDTSAPAKSGLRIGTILVNMRLAFCFSSLSCSAQTPNR